MAYATRKTARAIILTPDKEVLMIRHAFPWRDRDVWILPGGGIEQDEDVLSAVTREVFEETGATGLQIIGEAWRQESVIQVTNTLLKQRYFLVRADRFIPEPTALSEEEMDWVKEYRWWTVTSLSNTDENLDPVHIAESLSALIQHGLPDSPITMATS